ncbi:hypothetical protein HMPREF0083_04735 [Aneurinibacillus aneurinilyticus ATCC 12856]|uniref:Uncharacterized protein n=1 Tax=Aneurinibacillus aneurinilyticus ATCC 12856 TaxID=649747 RepID=U1Y4R6_ANEAE|nr:hypothetical protein HMPREF0083_04735 [Aneurinibacillus aneurinilyticus ATCC 12856]
MGSRRFGKKKRMDAFFSCFPPQKCVDLSNQMDIVYLNYRA